jgi:hypothetical protein
MPPRRVAQLTSHWRRNDALARNATVGLSDTASASGSTIGFWLSEALPLTSPAQLGRLAAAFGSHLVQERTNNDRLPEIVVANDGYPTSAEFVARAAYGLRWASCHGIEIGAATTAATAFAVQHGRFDGGILIGEPLGHATALHVRIWTSNPQRFSDAFLAPLRRGDLRLDRPTRRFGTIRRASIAECYLATFHEAYHGLRPLRVLLHSESPAVDGYLGTLCNPTACEIIACGDPPRRIAESIVRHKAHLGVRMGRFGERCEVFDEQGRPVDERRLAAILAPSPPSIGLAEIPTPAMGIPDALTRITRLLTELSRSDRAFSEVLDDAPEMG